MNPFDIASILLVVAAISGYLNYRFLRFPATEPLFVVVIVCDNAAQEICPIWPGQPMTAHWGIADPAAVEGSDEEKERAFTRTLRELDARLKIFISLRLEALDRLALQRQLDAIGHVRRETTLG